MDLLVLPDGTVRAIYAEDIDLGVLGRQVITRASHVEPDEQGHWLADLTPVIRSGSRPVPEAEPGARGRTGVAGSQLAHPTRLSIPHPTPFRHRQFFNV